MTDRTEGRKPKSKKDLNNWNGAPIQAIMVDVDLGHLTAGEAVEVLESRERTVRESMKNYVCRETIKQLLDYAEGTEMSMAEFRGLKKLCSVQATRRM